MVVEEQVWQDADMVGYQAFGTVGQRELSQRRAVAAKESFRHQLAGHPHHLALGSLTDVVHLADGVVVDGSALEGHEREISQRAHEHHQRDKQLSSMGDDGAVVGVRHVR